MQFVVRMVRALGVAVAVADADDVAQEVFVIAHRRRDHFDGGSARGWLYGIARNVARDHRRLARHREVAASDALPDRPAETPPDDLELLRRAVATLDDAHQDALLLYDLAECTLAEAAAALAVPPGTLKDRIRRARQDVRAEIERLEGAT